jgi:hypothetical protein
MWRIYKYIEEYDFRAIERLTTKGIDIAQPALICTSLAEHDSLSC